MKPRTLKRFDQYMTDGRTIAYRIGLEGEFLSMLINDLGETTCGATCDLESWQSRDLWPWSRQ